MLAISRALRVAGALLVAAVFVAHADAATISIAVDTTLDRRPISPAIYGVDFGDVEDFASVPYSVRRWGGNATTRYSWQFDTHNTGSDWFFFTIVEPSVDGYTSMT